MMSAAEEVLYEARSLKSSQSDLQTRIEMRCGVMCVNPQRVHSRLHEMDVDRGTTVKPTVSVNLELDKESRTVGNFDCGGL